MKIAPSILAADFGYLGKEVTNIERAGADWIHIDIMDGHFVPNITFGPDIVKTIRSYTKIPLDVHLMIEHPDQHIKAFCESGADIISVHQEACTHLHRTLSFIKSLGKKSGVVLNPATPLTLIKPVLPEVDLVLFMSVNPGFGGQVFIPSVLPKIRELKEIVLNEGYQIDIEVDGGVNEITGQQCVKSGATVLVAGSYIFGSKDIEAAIQGLRK